MIGGTYYRTRLSGNRLRRCYDLAPPRVRQYLEAEIAHVLHRTERARSILELGCGYGRVLERLERPGRRVVGIDTSLESLLSVRDRVSDRSRCDVSAMDAAALAFRPCAFDAVICIQNGVCAFRADALTLLREALRVARPGGRVLLSTYAAAFWPHRLRWFRLQGAEGLVGDIDETATRLGEIVCTDGFRSGTLSADDFTRLCSRLGVEPRIVEVDGSSLFCEVGVRG